MNKRFFALIIAFLLFNFTACNNTTEGSNDVATTSTEITTSSVSTSEDNIEYHLDIENEILSSTRVLTRNELDTCGYNFRDVSEQFGYDEAALTYIKLSEKETSTIEVLYTTNAERSIEVNVSEQMIAANELSPRADITICLESCTVRVYDWGISNDGTTIKLHDDVETALRTILCIDNLPQ